MKLNTKPLSGIEVGIPIISPQIVDIVFTKVDIKPNSKNTGDNLNLEMKVLNATLVKEDGSEFQNNGIPMYRVISLVETDGSNGKRAYDPNQALKEIAAAIEHPSAIDDRVDFESSDIVGKRCKAKVVIDKESEDKVTGKTYPAKNSVQRFYPAGDSNSDLIPDTAF